MSKACYDRVAAMIDTAAARIVENHELLSKLDSATGDGDHGTTMLRIAKAMQETVKDNGNKAIQPLLEAVGWAVMSVDGGSIAPLLGSWFMGMSEAPEANTEALDSAGLAAVLEAGTAKLRAQTQAQPGDKTLIDALVPAVEALKAAAAQGKPVDAALADAAEAAVKAAEQTRELQARFGRARNLGARTIGHQDPGATSMSLLFTGFRDGVAAVQR
jgi:dihydroxyacetone kinase-like protein